MLIDKRTDIEETSDIFQTLYSTLEGTGANFKELCIYAGINRDTVAKWKDREPKTIQILRKMKDFINREREKAGMEKINELI